MAQYDDLKDYDWLAPEVDRHETPQAMALGALLLDKLKPRSVIDIGCSSGIYLVPFREAGCRILGVDGAPGVGGQIPGAFAVHDLRTADFHWSGYDLALCIEVGEHVPMQFADNVVNACCMASKTVFFCAARVGQGGEGHINCQPQSYWKEKFTERGYEKHPLDDEINEMLEADDVYTHCGWLRWNSFLVQKKVFK